MESIFHKAIHFSLEKLNYFGRELKKEQYDAIRAICIVWRKRMFSLYCQPGLGNP